jgi:hypothetical protein
MKWFVALVLLVAGCEDALTQVDKDRRKLQADWWADVRQGANAGCIHPKGEWSPSKCQAVVIHGPIIEFYELYCKEDHCSSPELVKCEVNK